MPKMLASLCLLCALAASLLVAPSDAATPETPATQSPAKTVAVFMVHSPKELTNGFFWTLQLQDQLDSWEGKVVTALKERGWQVVPPAESKALAEKEFRPTYIALMYESKNPKIMGLVKEGEKFAKQHKATLEDVINNFEQWNKGLVGVPSRNTGIVIDHLLPQNHKVGPNMPKGVPEFSEIYLNSLAQMARKMNADAFLMARFVPSLQNAERWTIQGADLRYEGKKPNKGWWAAQDATVYMFDTDGKSILQRRLFGLSGERLDSGMFTLKLDKEKSSRGVDEATDVALRHIFMELK